MTDRSKNPHRSSVQWLTLPMPRSTDREANRSAQDWYVVGSSALDRKDLREAEDAFGRAVLADPSHAHALFRLGQFAERRHDFKAAVRYFEDALTADPDHARAREHLADVAGKLPSTPSAAQQPKPKGPPRERQGNGIVGTVASISSAPSRT
jgi:tetratricopeptide (TPR) repeat protein